MYFVIVLEYFLVVEVKKLVIADNVASHFNLIFDCAAQFDAPSLLLGALGYSVQIYFDFSGYSDMAIGLARMFGIRFPMNFDSPYRAASIIEFWQRWHITLTRFLREYLYYPLGGHRRGTVRQACALDRRGQGEGRGPRRLRRPYRAPDQARLPHR